jgi:FkbM family methyltransferase
MTSLLSLTLLRDSEDHLRSAARYISTVGVGGLASALAGKVTQTPRRCKLTQREIRHPLQLRLPSSDVPTYCQIFVDRDYDFEVRRPPRVIVDAGANIGLAAVLFANRYPDAKIIAIEPETSNFELLALNVAPYPQIIPLHAALWNENRPISLVDPGLGKWGFMTHDEASGLVLGKPCGLVQGLTVDQVMRDHKLERIDILKLDIEGAEREVLESAGPWIDRVDAMLVELHDRMKPGCSRSFYNATNVFDDEWSQGENHCVTRNGACLLSPDKARHVQRHDARQ